MVKGLGLYIQTPQVTSGINMPCFYFLKSDLRAHIDRNRVVLASMKKSGKHRHDHRPSPDTCLNLNQHKKETPMAGRPDVASNCGDGFLGHSQNPDKGIVYTV